MVHDIDAIYNHGILRPVEPLELPEGTRVRLRVEEENGSRSTAVDYNSWLEGLAGRWQGQFARGDEGEFESRESLS
jgi:predicted DNA-binding antitoxin AbrB/MazE fold protein